MLKIEDLPKDAVIKIDPDFEAPGIEWVKRDTIEPFVSNDLITGTGLGAGLTTTVDVNPADGLLNLYHATQPMVIFEPNNNFVITGDNGEELICINMETGETTIGPEYHPDEAASVFWGCIEQYKQPDAWAENTNITSTEVLREVRDILGCGEDENVLEVARRVIDDAGYRKHIMAAPPGIADDMPESYYGNVTPEFIEDLEYFQLKFARALEQDGDTKQIEKMINLLTHAATVNKHSDFDAAMKVID